MRGNATPSEGVGRDGKGKNSSTVRIEALRQFHSFGRSGEMRENPTPSEGVQGRFTAKVALGEVSCGRGGVFADSHNGRLRTAAMLRAKGSSQCDRVDG